MKEAKFNKTGNKMIVESGYRQFDKETNYIGYGNVMANTMYGKYIRPYSCMRNGSYYTAKTPGELMRSDMEFFTRIPDGIRNILEDEKRIESYALYEFFVYPNGRKKIIGWILTDNNRHLVKMTPSWEGNVNKNCMALQEAAEYICVPGTMEIPEEVKNYFESLESVEFVENYEYDGKRYSLHAYSQPFGEPLQKEGVLSIYGITPVEDMTTKYRNPLLDIVSVDWDIPIHESQKKERCDEGL